MSRFHPSRHPRLAALLVILILGTVLGISTHVISASAQHDRAHCAACSYFHLYALVVSAILLLVYFMRQWLSGPGPLSFVSLSLLSATGRSPPY